MNEKIETKEVNLEYPESILDSRCELEAILLKIPSSKNILEHKKEIVDKFNHFGALVVEFQSNEDSRAQLLCFKDIFGNTISHDRADEDMIAEIAVSDNFQGYLGTSNVEHPFHTDGSYDEIPPYVVALRCDIAAQNGGITKLASGKAIYEELLMQDKAFINALFAPNALHVERAGKKSSQPVFRYENNRILIRYRSDETSIFLENQDTQKAILIIKNFLEKESNYMMFTLKEKQVLIVDNTRVLHARTAFLKNEPRKMHRLFFNGTTSSTTELTFGFSVN